MAEDASQGGLSGDTIPESEKTDSNWQEEGAVPGDQDESEILAGVLARGTKALSGCLPFCLLGILLIVILYVLFLIFRPSYS